MFDEFFHEKYCVLCNNQIKTWQESIGSICEVCVESALKKGLKIRTVSIDDFKEMIKIKCEVDYEKNNKENKRRSGTDD